MGISEEELIKWGKEKYPELGGNVKLLRILWEKLNKTDNGVKAKFTTEKKIAELTKGDRAKLSIVVIDIKKIGEYIGCSKCKKKQCDCGVEKRSCVVTDFIGADDTGELKMKFFGFAEQKFGIGDVLEVNGVHKGEFFNVWEVNLKRKITEEKTETNNNDRKQKAKELLKAMEGLGLTEVSELEKWLKRKGFELKDVIDELKVFKVNNKDVVML